MIVGKVRQDQRPVSVSNKLLVVSKLEINKLGSVKTDISSSGKEINPVFFEIFPESFTRDHVAVVINPIPNVGRKPHLIFYQVGVKAHFPANHSPDH